MLVPQLYLTIWEPMDLSPPGSSVHGMLQARILELVALPFSRADGKESTRNEKDLGFIPGSGRSPEEGNGPTSVSLPGAFHGQRSPAGYSPWGHKESDRTERLTHTHRHTHLKLIQHCISTIKFFKFLKNFRLNKAELASMLPDFS